MLWLNPYSRPGQNLLIHAASLIGDHGHSVFSVLNDFTRRLVESELVNFSSSYSEIPSRYSLNISSSEWKNIYTQFLIDLHKEKAFDQILPVSSSDGLLVQIAGVNEQLGLRGISLEQAEIYSEKCKYLSEFSKLGIPVPANYEVVPEDSEPKNYHVKYPCVCKPSRGTGGFGVYVASSAENMKWFFSPSDNPENSFSPLSLFNQTLYKGKPRNYLYANFQGSYLVQEYIEGPCVSICGTIVGEKITVDLIYDIEILSPPYRTESGFVYPGQNQNIKPLVYEMVTAINKHLTLPDGAYMLDLIISKQGPVVVDFSPRCSSTGIKMLNYILGENIYGKNVLRCLLKSDAVIECSNGRPVSWRFFDFPSGTIQRLSLPPKNNKILDLDCNLKVGDKLFEPRNDLQIAARGGVVVTGDTPSEVEKNMNSYLNDIDFEVSN